MDEERDIESQSSTYSPLCLSWWMMRNLWQQGVSEERHLRVNIVDTVLLEDGHLTCWYFTSAKSGLVLKRNEKQCEWEKLVRFLVRAAKGTWGSGNDRWTSEVIATARRLRDDKTTAVMLTASDITSLREKHNAHLLDEIVAVQPYVTRKPFSGCGLFETTFIRKEGFQDAQVACLTYELTQWQEESSSNCSMQQKPGGGRVISPDIPEDGVRRQRGALEESLSSLSTSGSRKRVHGVLHRILASTTKDIVGYVERETGEQLMQVVAQFAFRPGSGQPTLLWLESATTLHSTQPQPTLDGSRNELEHGGDQTRRWGEEDTRWTTYFPMKLCELGAAAVSSAVASGLVDRLAASMSGNDLHDASLTDATSPTAQEKLAPSSSVKHTSIGTPSAIDGRCVPGESMDNAGLPGVPITQTPEDVVHDEFSPGQQEGDHGHSVAGHSVNAGHAAGLPQHYALPTESWATRFAGLRGLYFTHGAGAGRGALASRDRWPRKRSTGTTMRIDDERPDLRMSSESPRLSTAPARISEPMKHGMQGTRSFPMDAISCRLSSRSNGCFGDFCKYGLQQPPSSRASHGWNEDGRDHVGYKALSKPSKLVSYRSILKCRAEEKAIALKVGPGVSSGYPGPGHLGLPIPTASDCVEDKDPETAFREAQAQLASVVSARMRVLASCLNEDGRGEYSRLSSSDRRRVGAPEVTQRATEELMYEHALSHLYPTTICRSVTVCDNCAMVYGYMDLYRRKTKRLKQLALQKSRNARVAWRREQLAIGRGSYLSRASTAPSPNTATSTLRRYSSLNLAAAGAAAAGAATSDGLVRLGAGKK